jgi:cadmium resistance protein CadD (predicted permease)
MTGPVTLVGQETLLASLFTAIAVGVLVFATTNIDDILLLAAFFADRTMRPTAVVVGQFAGIAVLTIASAVAALLALTVPDGWIALLGVAPLVLGIRGLHALWRSGGSQSPDEGPEAGAVEARSARVAHSQWIAVALTTVANGGDNLGVYIPLFSRELAWVPLYAIVFAILTAVWCGLGYWLVHHPVAGARIRQYGHVALPFVLLGLGLYILADARALLR